MYPLRVDAGQGHDLLKDLPDVLDIVHPLLLLLCHGLAVKANIELGLAVLLLVWQGLRRQVRDPVLLAEGREACVVQKLVHLVVGPVQQQPQRCLRLTLRQEELGAALGIAYLHVHLFPNVRAAWQGRDLGASDEDLQPVSRNSGARLRDRCDRCGPCDRCGGFSLSHACNCGAAYGRHRSPSCGGDCGCRRPSGGPCKRNRRR
mmetsp:Transcript_67640/g.161373  ORF Transcript_67640/g.161373 Transcript_67640/m.161373 type:complete len:204 (-) Transcript_67640:390-1001(-)